MGPHWKLEVEGLGKIERAEVELRPLTLLVGANNTGKSYLASLAWGLIAMQSELILPAGPTKQACEAWVEEHISEGKFGAHDLGPSEIELLSRMFDETLEANNSKLIPQIFNSTSVTANKIRFHNLVEHPFARLGWSSPKPGLHVLELEDGMGRGKKSLKTSIRSDNITHVRSAVLDLLIRRGTFGPLTRLFTQFFDDDEDVIFHPFDPIFFPASRTGFMQLYKAVVQKALSRWFREGATDGGSLGLTLPAFHFINMLAYGLPDKPASRFAAEADFLEQGLDGTITRAERNGGVNKFFYTPANTTVALEMPLASSLITELAPIILALRHLESFPVLILEEPEAHLHPKMQRHLARTIVRLVRKGLYVWVTTHSENFCQQINNFIKIGESEKRTELQQKLGYEEQEYLRLDDVSGYQFTLQKHGKYSEVRELDKTAQGLSMPTFNEELMRLTKEVVYLQGETTE